MRSLLATLFLFPIAISALETIHFLHYYPFYSPALGGAYQNCTSSYEDVMASPSSDTCKFHMNCLIKNIDEINKADMASATVLLGLAPAMLAMVGPNIAEISLLSSRRPILSFLVAMSAPALNIGSLFEFQSPVQALRDRRKELKFTAPMSPASNPELLYILVILQYVFLLGSIANVASNSFQLGVYTIVSWKCQEFYMPVIWTSLAAVPWLFAFSCAKLYKWKTVAAPKSLPEFINISDTETTNVDQKQTWLRNEISTFKLRPYSIQLQSNNDPICATILNAFSWICVYTLLWFGTLAMSSLLFISTLDALSVIMRYLASAIVSRLVLQYELEDVSWVSLKAIKNESWEDQKEEAQKEEAQKRRLKKRRRSHLRRQLRV